MPPNGKPAKAPSLAQAAELQELLMKASRLISGEIESSKVAADRGKLGISLSHTARAWDCLEERKRILKNKPKMGNIDPNSIPKKKKWGVKGVVAFSENADVQPGVVEEKKKVEGA